MWVCEQLFKSLLPVLWGTYPEVGLLRQITDSIFNFLGNHHSVSLSNNAILHSHQQHTSVQFLHILTNTDLQRFLNTSHPNGCEAVCLSFDFLLTRSVGLLKNISKLDKIIYSCMHLKEREAERERGSQRKRPCGW